MWVILMRWQLVQKASTPALLPKPNNANSRSKDKPELHKYSCIAGMQLESGFSESLQRQEVRPSVLTLVFSGQHVVKHESH